jgi:hypothetical protein
MKIAIYGENMSVGANITVYKYPHLERERERERPRAHALISALGFRFTIFNAN